MTYITLITVIINSPASSFYLHVLCQYPIYFLWHCRCEHLQGNQSWEVQYLVDSANHFLKAHWSDETLKCPNFQEHLMAAINCYNHALRVSKSQKSHLVPPPPPQTLSHIPPLIFLATNRYHSSCIYAVINNSKLKHTSAQCSYHLGRVTANS